MHCLLSVRDRLQPRDSYINGYSRPTPQCVPSSKLATVCRCEDGRSFFNCTTDDRQTKIRIHSTTLTDSCWPMPDGFRHMGRRKRAAVEQEAEDDDIILPNDFQIPVTPNITEFPPPPTWPTPSGITEQQATGACQRVVKSYAAYNVCREYVDLESFITTCVLNVQVGNAAQVVLLYEKT